MECTENDDGAIDDRKPTLLACANGVVRFDKDLKVPEVVEWSVLKMTTVQ